MEPKRLSFSTIAHSDPLIKNQLYLFERLLPCSNISLLILHISEILIGPVNLIMWTSVVQRL